jgi:AcrR family transcriptional regulator
VAESTTQREERRRQTRARLLDAAVAEFQRAGADAADINAIARSAGVARSTFYFHFPTREHVLLELIRHDEAHLTRELGRFLDTPHDLAGVLTTTVELVTNLEERWGATLFRDVLSLYFSPTRPEPEKWVDHPLFVLLAAEIERSRIRGELYDDVDASHSAAFFLIGIYALLTTDARTAAARADALRKFVTSSLRSMQRI